MSIIRSHKKLLSKFSIPQNAPIPSYSFLPLSTSNQLTNTSISQQKSSPIFPIHLRGSCGNKYFTVISNYQPIAVDPVITEGIVYFEAAIQGLNKINDESVGIMDSSITFIPESTPRNQSPNQTVFYSGQKGQIEHMEREVNGNAQFLCDQRIGAEVDMDSTPRTLHFFVEDVEQPIFVVGIPAAIRFFVSISQQGSSFKVSKFERRYHSTAKGVHGSKSFEYGKKWNDPNRNIYNDFNLPPVIDQFKTNFGYQDDQSKIDQNRIKSIDPILIESKEQDCKVEENTIIHTQYNYNYCLTTFNPIIQSRNGIFRFETVFKNHKSESFSVGIVNSTECFERNQLAPKKKGAAVYYSSKFGEVYNLVSNNKIEGNSAFFCGQRVGIEVNMNIQPHTLHFFVYDVQMPIFIIGVPDSIRFFAYLKEKNSSFEVVKFEQIFNSSVKIIDNQIGLQWGEQWKVDQAQKYKHICRVDIPVKNHDPSYQNQLNSYISSHSSSNNSEISENECINIINKYKDNQIEMQDKLILDSSEKEKLIVIIDQLIILFITKDFSSISQLYIDAFQILIQILDYGSIKQKMNDDVFCAIVKHMYNCAYSQLRKLVDLTEAIVKRGAKHYDNIFKDVFKLCGLQLMIEDFLEDSIMRENTKEIQSSFSSFDIQLSRILLYIRKNHYIESQQIIMFTKIFSKNINALINNLKSFNEENKNDKKQIEKNIKIYQEMKRATNNLQVLGSICYSNDRYSQSWGNLFKYVVQLIHLNCDEQLNCPFCIKVPKSDLINELQAQAYHELDKLINKRQDDTIDFIVEKHQIMSHTYPIFISFFEYAQQFINLNKIDKIMEESILSSGSVVEQALSLCHTLFINNHSICKSAAKFSGLMTIIANLSKLKVHNCNEVNKDQLQSIRSKAYHILRTFLQFGGDEGFEQIVNLGFISQMIICISMESYEKVGSHWLIECTLYSMQFFNSIDKKSDKMSVFQKEIQEQIEIESGIEEIEALLFEQKDQNQQNLKYVANYRKKEFINFYKDETNRYY